MKTGLLPCRPMPAGAIIWMLLASLPAPAAALFNGAGQDILPLPAVFQSSVTVTAISAVNAGVTVSSGLVVSTGSVGIGTASPQARLDVLAGGVGPAHMGQIWRDGNGTIVSSVSATGVLKASYFEGNGSRLTGLTGDNLGDHTATKALDMAGFPLSSISTITFALNSVVIIPALTGGNNSTYAISIGTGATNNYAYGVGIGAYAGNNYSYGVGIGSGAANNNSNGVGILGASNSGSGVGIGWGASNNYTFGIGVGYGASGNHTSGLGIGYGAANNHTFGVGIGSAAVNNFLYGVGIGANASGNDNYAIGIGAFSQNSKNYGVALGAYTYSASSSVALGSYAKANADNSLALGAGTVNNSTWTASFGSYAIFTSSNVTAAKFYGDGSGLTNVGGGDNLGNHIATTTLLMGAYPVYGTGPVTMSSFTATGIGVWTPQLNLASGVRISSATPSQGGGVYVSTNLYTAGTVTIASGSQARIAAASGDITIQPGGNASVVVTSSVTVSNSLSVSSGSAVGFSGPTGGTYIAYDSVTHYLIFYVDGIAVARFKK